SDETGSGALVFGTSPTFTTQITTPKVVGDGTGLYLYDDDSNGIFVEDGGNVGIGTTNPSRKLHIVQTGGTNDTYLKIEEKGAAEANRLLFSIANNGTTRFGIEDTSADGSQWEYSVSGSRFSITKLYSGGPELSLEGAESYAHTTLNFADKFKINTSGDVGIGTTNPSGNLDINAATDADPHFLLSENNVTKWDIYNDHSDDALQIKAGTTLRAELQADGKFNANITPTVTTVTTTHTMTVAEAGVVLVSASSDYTITLPTAVGNTGLTYKFKKTDANYNCITLDGNGSETINYENADGVPKETYARLNTYGAEVTLVSDGSNWQAYDEALGQVPECHVYRDGSQSDVPTNQNMQIAFNAEIYDIGNNYDMATLISGTADGTVADHLQDDTTTPFLANMVGMYVKNTTDNTYAWITAFNDAGDVTLSKDIFVNGEGYEIKKSQFLAPIDGKYQIITHVFHSNAPANKRFQSYLKDTGRSTGTTLDNSIMETSIVGNFINASNVILELDKDTIIALWDYSDTDGTADLLGTQLFHNYMIVRLIAKD
ncbi:MAG: hypothetical protein ACTSPI_14050, partial [Candidatus Heimdallarchaeaceae archaeon]